MRLHREIAGSGPPLLLVHAGGFDARMWQPLVQRLADHFRCVMPDLRGHGRTPMPAEPYADAEDLVALLDELGLERVPVIGASFGGYVALELVTAAPERVAALVTMAALFELPEWSEELAGYWEQEKTLIESGDIDAAVQLTVRTWVREPAVADLVADMSRGATEAQLGVDAPARELPVDLAAISVPTLVVSAGRDLPDFSRIADHIAAEVRGAQRAEVPDAGHLIALERPDAAAELLVPFLERVGA